MFTFHKLAMLLIIIGAINSGLVGVLHTDLIVGLFGTLSHVIYVLVGVSGVYMALTTYTTLLKKTA